MIASEFHCCGCIDVLQVRPLYDVGSSARRAHKLNSLFIVSPYMATNLHRVIVSRQHLSYAHVQFLMLQVFSALQYLHARGVIHRNLIPANVLVNEACDLVLDGLDQAMYVPRILYV